MDKIKNIGHGLAVSLGVLNKLSLSAAILIASIILGGFFYASQVKNVSPLDPHSKAVRHSAG